MDSDIADGCPPNVPRGHTTLRAVRKDGDEIFTCQTCYDRRERPCYFVYQVYVYRGGFPVLVDNGVPLNSLLVMDDTDNHVCEACFEPFAIDGNIYHKVAAVPTCLIEPEEESEMDALAHALDTIRNSPFRTVLTPLADSEDIGSLHVQPDTVD
jgi:hypothetical protein